MRSALNKRLDAVEQGFGKDTFVLVWKGTPPYIVTVTDLRNHKKEIITIDTPDELDAYLASLPKSTQPVILDFGDYPSREARSLAQ